jgi:acyl carrier protein
VREKLVGIIAKTLSVGESEVSEEKNFREDFGADSLDLVELVMNCEEAFGVEISDDDAEKMKTVGDVVRMMETLYY